MDSARPTGTAPAPARAASPIRLEAEVPFVLPEPRPRLEILSPVFGETLPELGLRRHELRIALEPATLAPGQSVALSFDGLKPRVLGADTALVLGDVIPEDHLVAAGPHTLLAVVVDADGRALVSEAGSRSSFALVDFFVGKRSGVLPRPEAPRLFCLSPAGTYHAEQTERPVLQLFPVGNVGAVSIRVRAGELDFEGELDPRRPQRILGLSAGDVRVEASGAGGLRAHCVATLNPEGKAQ
jgi:hypothetical protein